MNRISSPRDLPDLRLWLIDQWRPGGMFDEMAQANKRVTPAGVKMVPDVERHNLPKAALWWATEDMSSLVDHAAKTLPPTTLTAELMPARHGLVAFARDLAGIDSVSGATLSVGILSWCLGRMTLPTGPVPNVSIHAYQWHRPRGVDGLVPLSERGFAIGAPILDAGVPSLVMGPVDHPGPVWVPIGKNDWIMGTDTEEQSPGVIEATEDRLASMSEDRRWLAALWLLASQPLAESITQIAPRPAARRSQRRKVASDVRLVDVRRAKAPRGPSEGTHGPHREYSHRFIVGGEEGGFWRQQACGPQWSQHRPVWVAAFVKGPPDKPLKLRETVHVVREDP